MKHSTRGLCAVCRNHTRHSLRSEDPVAVTPAVRGYRGATPRGIAPVVEQLVAKKTKDSLGTLLCPLPSPPALAALAVSTPYDYPLTESKPPA